MNSRHERARVTRGVILRDHCSVEVAQDFKCRFGASLPHPRRDDALAATLALDGRCVATSGDYASPFTPDLLHHHIFDPATGDSPTGLASVTVLAPTGLEADGLSTAFMVMGARRAHALAAHLPGVDLLTIAKDGRQWMSAGFPAV